MEEKQTKSGWKIAAIVLTLDRVLALAAVVGGSSPPPPAAAPGVERAMAKRRSWSRCSLPMRRSM